MSQRLDEIAAILRTYEYNKDHTLLFYSMCQLFTPSLLQTRAWHDSECQSNFPFHGNLLTTTLCLLMSRVQALSRLSKDRMLTSCISLSDAIEYLLSFK